MLELQPGRPGALAALADAVHYQGRYEEALQNLAQAASREPQNLLRQLAPAMLCPFVFADSQAIDDYRRDVAQRLDQLAAGAGQGTTSARFTIDLDQLADSGNQPPISWVYQGRDDLPLKSRYADLIADCLRTHPHTKAHFPGEPAALQSGQAGRPHLGFVVTGGSEGIFLRGMAQLITRIDPRRFRVTIICPPAAVASCQRAISAEHVEYLPLPKPILSAVAAIRSARCQVLYYWEIGTDSSNYLLPFWRLAPVQCTSWGWPVTSGIATVDYFISSSLLEPEGAAAHYREQLIQFPAIPNLYRQPDAEPAADRAAFGWSPRQHIYFCGQSPRKIHPDFDLLLGEILRGDPDGVAVLVAATLAPVTAALRARFAARAPDVAERIQFVPRMSAAGYRALSAAADVALDTPHYSGGANSTYDVVAATTPLVTLPGAYHRGRYTAAVCRLLDLQPECVATTAAEYVQKAVRLAGDRPLPPASRRRCANNGTCCLTTRPRSNNCAAFLSRPSSLTRIDPAASRPCASYSSISSPGIMSSTARIARRWAVRNRPFAIWPRSWPACNTKCIFSTTPKRPASLEA